MPPVNLCLFSVGTDIKIGNSSKVKKPKMQLNYPFSSRQFLVEKPRNPCYYQCRCSADFWDNDTRTIMRSWSVWDISQPGLVVVYRRFRYNKSHYERKSFESGFGGLGVSVLASGTQVRGFKPGRSRRIFKGRKIIKTVGPMSQICGM
jgi:hypothetical protein